ncbi:hypothetical protein D9619_009336 [Psilocybe cf. subviscida]|uniref:Hydrophobin n=1 Tax=Psilocybe cf. subviscida TaxID=2480587 RepID=A0A8H5BUH6_9AGAR|nr:hypothetical protein D9619_009336 [Psilocybe cf. subviscida]
MQFKLAALTTLAVATLAAATPTGTDPSNQCNTGSLECCNSVQSANSPSIAGLLGLLGIVAGTLTGQVGVTCSPITAIGLGGSSCSAQPVCCTNNTFSPAANRKPEVEAKTIPEDTAADTSLASGETPASDQAPYQPTVDASPPPAHSKHDHEDLSVPEVTENAIDEATAREISPFTKLCPFPPPKNQPPLLAGDGDVPMSRVDLEAKQFRSPLIMRLRRRQAKLSTCEGGADVVQEEAKPVVDAGTPIHEAISTEYKAREENPEAIQVIEASSLETTIGRLTETTESALLRRKKLLLSPPQPALSKLRSRLLRMQLFLSKF